MVTSSRLGYGIFMGSSGAYVARCCTLHGTSFFYLAEAQLVRRRSSWEVNRSDYFQWARRFDGRLTDLPF